MAPDLEALTGFSVAEINALPGGFFDLIDRRDLPRLWEEVRELPEGGGTLVMNYRIATRGGEVREIEDRVRRAAGSPDKVEGLLFDVGERLALQRRGLENGARFVALVQTMVDGYWLVDPDTRIVDVNDEYCRMSGYAR